MRAILAGLLVVMAALPAAALEKRVRVAPGESLEAVAERLYGDGRAAAVLRRQNGIEGDTATGGELRAPFSDRRKVRPGETWSSLARELWGDGRLAGDLALTVTGDEKARLIAGRSIPVPVLVEERLGRGQTLAALSRRYYDTSDRAGLLMRVNGIRDARRLRVGARVRVPVVLEEDGHGSPEAPRAEAERADNGPVGAAAAAERPAPPPPDVSAAPASLRKGSFDVPLREAINTYLDGSYDEALSELEELRPAVLERGDRYEQSLLLRHLVFVYVAFDQPERACETWGDLRTVDPDVRFDADLVSPKIRQLVSHCGN